MNTGAVRVPAISLEMTWRAKFYLVVCGLRHASLGVTALLMRDAWRSVDAGIPIWAWGLVFLGGAMHLIFAAAAASESNARVALAVSAVITSVWAASFWTYWASGVQHAIVLAIVFTALTLKDLTIVRDPMRSPFEPIIREYIDRNGR